MRACAGWRPIIYFDYHKIPTPITQEPDIVESSGFWHSVALIDAEFKFFFRFLKMRAQEGQRLKNCLYNTLSNSTTVWHIKFNFASFRKMKYPQSKKIFRFDVLCACAGWRPILYFGYHKILTPITQEPDIVESFGLWHSVALIDAEFKFFSSDFWKCVRRRAEGRKTVFTIPSLT